MSAQRSVFSRPWYWVAIGAGLALIALLLFLTASQGANAEQPKASSPEPTSTPKPAAIKHGDGSSFDAPVAPGTEITVNNLSLDDVSSDDWKSTVQVTGANFDGTAEALAEDPWADLMLEPGEKLAIVDFDITNHSNDTALAVSYLYELQLAEADGTAYQMDVVQVALEQPQVRNQDFPKGETVHAVAVYFVPDDLDASSARVRVQTEVSKDDSGNYTYVYAATE